MAIVYMASDRESADFYIGYSADDDVHHRRRSHEHDACRASPRTLFDRALKERGPSRFEWETLWAGLSFDEARRREAEFVRWLRPTLNGIGGGSGGRKRIWRRRMLLPVTPIEGERWRPIPGFEGHYEVSDHGRIMSLSREVPNPGTGTMLRRAGLLRTPAPRGRPCVTLCKDGKEYNRKVQAIVAETFLGRRPPGLGVLHRDDDKMNNRPENLYYGTAADNTIDKIRNGKVARGERSGTASITDVTAREIVRLAGLGVRQCDIIRATGISKTTISHILRGRTWTHLGLTPAPPQSWEYPDRRVVLLNTGQVFVDAPAAAVALGLRPSKIVEACQGTRGHLRGMGFRFEGEHEGVVLADLLKEAKRRKGRQRKSVVCCDDGLEFESMSEAAAHYGLTVSQISEVARGNRGTAGGKRFAPIERET